MNVIATAISIKAGAVANKALDTAEKMETNPIETKTDDKYVYWKYVNDTEWKVLLDLGSIYNEINTKVNEAISNIKTISNSLPNSI